MLTELHILTVTSGNQSFTSCVHYFEDIGAEVTRISLTWKPIRNVTVVRWKFIKDKWNCIGKFTWKPR